MNEFDLFRKNGDFLERMSAEQTGRYLPGYLYFWARFIGNNGKSEFLPMPDTAADANVLRELFWEHTYTIFESIALCWRIEDELSECRQVDTLEEYAGNLNQWMAFYAHLGRIHDMAEKVAAVFKGNGLYEPFDNFYRQRHIALHYPKVPMATLDSVLLAPRLGDKPEEWHKGLRWREATPEKFELVSDIVSSTLRELEKVTSEFLYKVAGLAESQGGFRPIHWEQKAEIKPIFPTKSDPLSDIYGMPPPPPSGTRVLDDQHRTSSLE